MRAILAFCDKQVLADGAIVEMVLWDLPESFRIVKNRDVFAKLQGATRLSFAKHVSPASPVAADCHPGLAAENG